MLEAIAAARLAMKSILEQTYEDKVMVSEMQKFKDATTKITSKQEIVVLTDVPCKLSVSSADKASDSGNVATISKVIKLFVAPTVQIKPGSKITVTKATGEVTDYARSSEPVVYASHAEYILELFKGYA